MEHILDGKKVAATIENELRHQLANIEVLPSLGILQVGQNPASTAYINQKKKVGARLGITIIHRQLPDNASSKEVERVIVEWNQSEITGYLLQLPLPQHLNLSELLAKIPATKDVDGLSPFNIGQLAQNLPCVLPATTRGIENLLQYYGIEVEGKNVVIIGRSNLVGKPTALHLLNRHATVTVAHSKSAHLAQITQHADILITAIGAPRFITSNYTNPNMIVIDVGITRRDEQLVGDVDFEDVAFKVKAISPVPGGIGPLTVLGLFQNLFQLHQSNHT